MNPMPDDDELAAGDPKGWRAPAGQAQAAGAAPDLAVFEWTDPGPLPDGAGPVSGHDARVAGATDGSSEGWVALRASLASALSLGWGEVWFLAPSFECWPLASSDWLSMWQAAAARGPVLHWLTQDDTPAQVRWPRWWTWLKQQGHRWDAGLLPAREGGAALHCPHAVLTPDAAWMAAPQDPRRPTVLDWRLISSPVERQGLKELADAFSQRARPTWQLTTLGL
jgi:hypothetical protein